MEFKKLTVYDIYQLKSKDKNYFSKIMEKDILESALHESIKSMNKEMIEYFLERGVEVKILHMNKILAASDNLKYIQYLEEKGIDIYQDKSRIILDAICAGREKTAIYMMPYYKEKGYGLKISGMIAIDRLNDNIEPKKNKQLQNIISNILVYVDEDLKTFFLDRIKKPETKSFIFANYLELKTKDIPESTKKVKANKI